MVETPSAYTQCFHADDTVSIGIHFPDNTFIEDSATILFIENDITLLELYGHGLPANLEARAGAEVIVTSREGWALYRCHAILEEMVTDREISLRLVGEVEVKQRREFFRMDVSIPIYYTLPANQLLSTVHTNGSCASATAITVFPPSSRHAKMGSRLSTGKTAAMWSRAG